MNAWGLRVKDLDFDRDHITVRQGKGRKGRVTCCRPRRRRRCECTWQGFAESMRPIARTALDGSSSRMRSRTSVPRTRRSPVGSGLSGHARAWRVSIDEARTRCVHNRRRLSGLRILERHSPRWLRASARVSTQTLRLARVFTTRFARNHAGQVWASVLPESGASAGCVACASIPGLAVTRGRRSTSSERSTSSCHSDLECCVINCDLARGSSHARARHAPAAPALAPRACEGVRLPETHRVNAPRATPPRPEAGCQTASGLARAGA